jgi:chemotaxis protein CheD
MANFMLADYGRDHANPSSAAARSGAQVMELLFGQMAAAGAKDPHAIEAKIFGGGRFGGTDFGSCERNIEFLRAFLAARRVRIAAENVLAQHARKVYFFPQTGRLLVRKILKANNNTILDRERDYRRRLTAAFTASGG